MIIMDKSEKITKEQVIEWAKSMPEPCKYYNRKITKRFDKWMNKLIHKE